MIRKSEKTTKLINENNKTIRNFKGVWIPKNIWINTELTWMEKLFLIEIDSLNNGKNGCYASNKHFAEFFNLSTQRCSQIISSLKNKKYVEIHMKRNGKEITHRNIYIIRGVSNILKGGIKYTIGGYQENDKGNNTLYNNTSIEELSGILDLTGFDEWYKTYPKKTAKEAARKSWNKIQKLPSKKRPLLFTLLKAVKEQSKSQQWQNKKYIPNPSTWLNQKRWEDEIETNNYKNNYSQSNNHSNEQDDPDDYQNKYKIKFNPANPNNDVNLPGYQLTETDRMYLKDDYDPFDDD